MKSKLRDHDIDLKVFANLMALSQQDGINQREIGKRLDFPEYYTSRNVDALVEAGLAERRADPKSRRSFLVFLTVKGRRKAAELPKVIADVNDDYLGSLTDEERETAITLLQKVFLEGGKG